VRDGRDRWVSSSASERVAEDEIDGIRSVNSVADARAVWVYTCCMKRSPRASREEWSQRVARWLRSGKSAEAYAAEIGVNVQTLRSWRWKLRQEEGEEARPRPRSRAGSRVRRSEASDLPFVELVAAPGSTREGFELVLAGSRRIVVPAAFDAAALTRLIAAVEAA